MPTELTLRQLDDPALLATKPRYAWHRGSIQPYSSLWITIARFALLNRPRPKILLQYLRGTKPPLDSTVLRLDGPLTWPDHMFVDLRQLAHELGEPLASFRWSSLGDFPVGLQQLFDPALIMCPACMAEAYHTVLFSLRNMARCPFHRVPLVRRCPNCSREMINRLVPQGIHAPICRCGHAPINEAHARRPPTNRARDMAMAGIVEWIEDKAKRYWTYMPAWHARGLQFNLLEQQFLLWRHEANEPGPPWLESDRRALDIREEHRRCVEQSGFRFTSLARIPGRAEPARSSEDYEAQLAQRPRGMFKCIRRYVIQHILGNRIKLLSKLDRFENLQHWPRLLQDDKLVLMALSFLLWSQSSNWGESEWEWLGRTVGSIAKPMPWRWPRPSRKSDEFPVCPAANEWVSDWLSASEVLDLWPSAAQVDAFVADPSLLLTSFHCVRRDRLQWWGWLDETGQLRLGVYRRTPGWIVAKRSAKEERRRTDAERIEQKQLRVRAARALAASAALERTDSGLWRAVDALPVDGRVPAKITGLALGKRAGAHAVIAVHRADDGQATWVLRCMELPIRQTATELASGMFKLKSAIRDYRRLQQIRASTGMTTPSRP